MVEKETAVKARQLNRPVYGKTGTSSNCADALFVGFDDQLAVGVWVGRDDNTPIGPKQTGATAALPIWMSFMSQVAMNTTQIKTLSMVEAADDSIRH